MHTIDLIVIVVYLIGITWFGARFRKSQKSIKDYFLGGHSAPWWAIALSIVSAETSVLTVISTPVLAFQTGGNFYFLQLVLGYLLARIVISVLFLPHYFRGEMYTAYELMRRRFGERIRRFTAGSFLILRALAEGIRAFAISIIISVVLIGPLLGNSELATVVSIAVIIGMTLFYTFEGGLTAVIWTDVVQMFLYVGGAILSFVVIWSQIQGGWPHIHQTAAAAGKLKFFDFDFSFTAEFFAKKYSFVAGLVGGCFLTTASHGTEQLIVQRLLAAGNIRQSRAALFGSWIVIYFQFALFLAVGVLLWIRYPNAPANDRLYPSFIWDHLPAGVAGLVIAAILAAGMSNLSAALNALASTSIMDFYKPWTARAGRTHPDDHYLRLARWATVAWGAVLFVIGFLSRHIGSALEAALTVASILYGGLLGVFLLGLLTKFVRENAAIAGMAAGLIVMVCVRLFTHIQFTWYVLIGTTTTFSIGCLASHILRESSNAAP